MNPFLLKETNGLMAFWKIPPVVVLVVLFDLESTHGVQIFHVFLLCRSYLYFVLKKYNPGRKIYTFSHNHGSGKWLYLKGNDPFGDTPIFH